jgi:hypothetical protein
MQNAVVVQPLTRDQLSEWLDAAGERLAGLRIALTDDEVLWELLSTPLLLNLATLAYAGQSATQLSSAGGVWAPGAVSCWPTT